MQTNALDQPFDTILSDVFGDAKGAGANTEPEPGFVPSPVFFERDTVKITRVVEGTEIFPDGKVYEIVAVTDEPAGYFMLFGGKDGLFLPEADAANCLEHYAPFVIDTEEKLNWAMRKVMLSEADEAAVKANADATIKKLRAWREIFTARFLADIEAYHRAELAKQNGKTKTLQHAYGKTALRNVGATVKTADAAAALERALVINPDRFTTRVLNTGEWTNYAKEQLAAGHPLPPGAVETPGHESFSMKVGSGKE